MCHRHLNSQFSILNSKTDAPAAAQHPLLGEAAERNFDHPTQPPLS